MMPQVVLGPKGPLLDNIQISSHLPEEFKTQGARIDNCGTHYNYFMCDCGVMRVKKRCCYRICTDCSKIRSLRAYDRYFPLLAQRHISRYKNAKGLKFLTLTIENKESITEGISIIYDSFSRFRRNKYIKDRIQGGLGSIEVKKGLDGLWNVHVHFIIDSGYLDMESHKKTGEDTELVRIWKQSVKAMVTADIRAVKDKTISLRYVLKYLTKGIQALSGEERAEFFKATFKRRLLFTFGDFYNFKKPIKQKMCCDECGGYYNYILEGSEEWEIAWKKYNTKNETGPPKTLIL